MGKKCQNEWWLLMMKINMVCMFILGSFCCIPSHPQISWFKTITTHYCSQVNGAALWFWWLGPGLLTPAQSAANQQSLPGDFPGGPVVKVSLSNTRDTGSIPDQWTKIPHSEGQLSSCVITWPSLCHNKRSCVLQWRSYVMQPGPNEAK